MLAQEISRLPPDEQIILRAGMLPMKTKRPTWFSDSDFTARVRPPPAIPTLGVEIHRDDGKANIAGKSRGRQNAITFAGVEQELEDHDEPGEPR
jgi:type IV secretion system protein VirD4